MTRKRAEILPVAEEELLVTKRRVSTGTVSVKTETFIEEQVATANLARNSVEVFRVPINRRVDSFPLIRTDGDTTIVPVVEERLVVERHLILVEEVHLRRQTHHEEVQIPVALRKQRALVERRGPSVPNPLQKDAK